MSVSQASILFVALSVLRYCGFKVQRSIPSEEGDTSSCMIPIVRFFKPLILLSDRNKTIFAAGFVTCFVLALDNTQSILCGRRLAWHKSISQIFVYFLSDNSIKSQNLRGCGSSHPLGVHFSMRKRAIRFSTLFSIMVRIRSVVISGGICMPRSIHWAIKPMAHLA